MFRFSAIKLLIENTSRKSDLSKPDISCQKHNLKPILTDYIYRIISSKMQKRQTQRNKFALIKKRYHTFFLDMIRVFYSRNSKVGQRCSSAEALSCLLQEPCWRYFHPSAIRYFTGKPNLLMVKSFFNLKLHFDKKGMISTG